MIFCPEAQPYPRDLRGYGEHPPDPRWPGGARIAVSLVLNVEEGGEYSVLHGDAHSETALTDMDRPAALMGARNLNVESNFAYGSRVGFWELMRLLKSRGLDMTVYAVGMALERSPDIAAALREWGVEVACHGYRWIDYHGVDEASERAHMVRCIEVVTRMVGRAPVGWYTGRPSINTRRLVAESGGFLYDSDAYDDDIPYWLKVGGRPHLVVPYSFDNNDSRMNRSQGFETGNDFFDYVSAAFDWLYASGEAGRPRMMSIGLHPRIIGRPGRINALARLIDYMQSHDKVWFASRQAIAQHWSREFPAE